MSWGEKNDYICHVFSLSFRHFRQRPVQFKDKSIKAETEGTERWRHDDTCASRQSENLKTACLMDQRTKIILTPEQTGHQTSTGSWEQQTASQKKRHRWEASGWSEREKRSISCQTLSPAVWHTFINRGYFVAPCLSSGLQEKLRLWWGSSCLPLQAVLWPLQPACTTLLRR